MYLNVRLKFVLGQVNCGHHLLKLMKALVIQLKKLKVRIINFKIHIIDIIFQETYARALSTTLFESRIDDLVHLISARASYLRRKISPDDLSSMC